MALRATGREAPLVRPSLQKDPPSQIKRNENILYMTLPKIFFQEPTAIVLYIAFLF